MKLAFLITSLLSTVAMAAPQKAPQSTSQGPQKSPQASVHFNTNMTRPAPSFALIPVLSIGGASAASYSQMKPTTAPNYRSDVSGGASYEAGVLAEFGRRSFVFQTGLLFKQHGLRFTESDRSGSSDYAANVEMTLKYLSLPVMAKYRIRISEGVRLAARAGAELAVFNGGQMKYDMQTSTSGQVVDRQSASADIKSEGNVRVVNGFLTAGIGPEFRLNPNQNVRVEAVYSRMLLPLTLRGAYDSLETQAINAMVSYAFAF